ncbi:MAG: WecB/TagA/CpsF family glycosyltransferase [bacterium]|nr:WecB/TagA/CpsF family glycosyltransferase [bacterium]
MDYATILGVRLAVTDYAGLLAQVRAAVGGAGQRCVNFCNVHVTMEAQRHAALRAALNAPNAMTVPDGMPLVWAMRMWGAPIRTRVYGPDFFDLCFTRAAELGWRHFLYGSTDATLALLQQRLHARFPAARIVGAHAPPFRPLTADEERADADRINASGADIVWVGLGAPKQELWVQRMAPALTAPVLVAIGAAFDFHAGTVKQAPDWMQDHGLEWLYRFIQEPRRLWKRYCYNNPRFIAGVLCERLRGRRTA